MSSWRISIFESSTDALVKRNLLSYQLVTITDPETRCNLTILQNDVEIIDAEEGEKEEGEGGEEDDEEKKAERGRSDSESSEVVDKYQHAYGDIVLEPSTSEHIDSNFLWVIESR